MAKDKELLRQAIADAKTVRETALANARMVLEEAFKPHLSSMISTRLRNEAEDVNEENLTSSGIAGGSVTADEPGPTMPKDAVRSSSNITNHDKAQEVEPMGEGIEELDPEMSDDDEFGGLGGDEMGAGAPDLGAGAPGASAVGASIEAPLAGAPDMAAPDMAAPDMAAGHEMGADEFGAGPGVPGAEDMGDDSLDLEAIIRELEADTQDSLQEPQLGEQFDDVRAGQEVDGPIKMKENAAVQDVPKKITPGQKVTGDKNSTGSSAADATTVEGVPGGKKVTPGQKVSEKAYVTEEVELDEILREMEAEEGAMTEAETQEIAAENVELKNSLREHREVIQFLREKLQEVNTLNAKLLYTNKLFKNFNLTVEQKTRVVDQFDRANSLREVKLVYTTLAESLGVKAVSRPKKTVTAITEGLASKTVGSTKPKSAPIVENVDAQVSRLQFLAGIKKK